MSEARTGSHKDSSTTHAQSWQLSLQSATSPSLPSARQQPGVSLSDNICRCISPAPSRLTLSTLRPCGRHQLSALWLVALRTWSLMSLRQLTDAVTAPRYNTTRWQTHCDKDIQAHQRVRGRAHMHSRTSTCALPFVLDNSSWVQPLFSIYSLLWVSPTR